MGGLAFASAPLYDAFCRVTGFGGTTQRAAQAPGVVSERTVTVRFDATASKDLPWRFKPAAATLEAKIGETQLAFYEAENRSDRPTYGVASYNVTPHKAGRYFSKIECFCFTEQTLDPGEAVDMPVLFYLDPELLDDPRMDDLTEITLSYTFFASEPAGGPTSGAD